MKVAPKWPPVASKSEDGVVLEAGKQAPARFTHDFQHAGRSYQLFKKQPTRAGAWYVRVQHEGRRVKFSLKTNNALAAEARAKARIDEVLEGRLPAVPAAVASLGQVLEIYFRSARSVLSIKERSVRNNYIALRTLMKRAGYDTTEDEGVAFEKRCTWADKISMREFNGALVRKFLQAMLARVVSGAAVRTGEGEDRARERVKRSAKSLLTQARSIFNKSMMRHYSDRLRLDEAAIEAFKSEPTFKLRAVDYQQPDDAIVLETFRGAESWIEPGPDGEKPGWRLLNQYKAFWLAVGCGLRAGEIGRVKKEHFIRTEGRLFLRSDFTGKDGEVIQVPVISDAVVRLEPFLAGDGYVLEGSQCERTVAVFRRMNAWMAAKGWRTQKKIHELRAYIGGKVTEQHGLTAAQHFLRHKDHRTTEQKYGRYFKLRNVDVKLGL